MDHLFRFRILILTRCPASIDGSAAHNRFARSSQSRFRAIRTAVICCHQFHSRFRIRPQTRLYSDVMSFAFPRVYPILDVSAIPQTDRERFLKELGEGLTEAGVTLLEYRNKSGDEWELIADAGTLRQSMPAEKVKLILDDRADLVEKLQFDGVH
ncbi:MAG: thiamine phosphate synthase, partial [Terracidiphilus sp.]